MPSKHVKRKSTVPNDQKFVAPRLKSLLQKPSHFTVLDLYNNLDRWKITLTDLCELNDSEELDRCLQILIRVEETPLWSLKREILLATCRVPVFFSWYLNNGLSLASGKWKYASIARNWIMAIERGIHRNADHQLESDFRDVIRSCKSFGNCSDNTPLKNPTYQGIVPTLSDFEESLRPPLEALPATGPIEDANLYLTVQMKLLREELLHDLRLQIQAIRKGGLSKCMTGIRVTHNDLFETFLHNMPTSIKYTPGSLLILSTTYHFTDLLLATVTELNAQTGQTKVELISAENMLNVDIFSVPLIMTGCPVFFEPIYRVHLQLAQLLDDGIPFQDVLLKFNTIKQRETVRKSNPITTGLYPAQVKAVTEALTQRLTLIEGPPGTGKSLVGQKIIENLLSTPGKRIVVISVTNHALDDVLKGLLATTQNIIRFGTQSKERELDEFNVRNVECELPFSNLIRDALHLSKTRYIGGLDTTNLPQAIHRRQHYLRLVQEIRNIETLIKIQSKSVIGMTTAAAARLHILLELYEPHVLVAEEAAEILECHTIAALTKSLEQVIFIGDHHQLRATLQVPHLASKYQFDISLFERLITNGVEPVLLDLQSRMRPELAEMLRGTFYSPYKDNESVHALPSRVLGVEKNLFFLDHDHQETSSEGKSKGNLFEAQFSLQLSDYLLKQGYDAEQIVILSFYNGHLDVINAMRRANTWRHLTGVRAKTVDNFQGEEADIVILNAVRSNEEQSIGHVRVKNRICTAVSRQRCALYIAGNAQLLKDRSSVWSELIDKLQAKAEVGRVFLLKCQRHGNLMPVEGGGECFSSIVNSSGGCLVDKCGFKCPTCGSECLKECHPLLHDCKC